MRRLISQLLCPPRCAACGKLMAPTLKGTPTCLCAPCREAWEQERVAECPTCHRLLSECRCVSGLMEKAGVSAHVKLMPYGEGRVIGRLIGAVKRRGTHRAFTFLAEELRPLVLAAVREAKNETATPPEAVISFLPRTQEAKRKYGYDQAERLARALSKATGLRFLPLFSRQRAGILQKTLNRRQRVKNTKGAFALRRDVFGLRVLLVDDVVTTGAGMAEAARLLYHANAADVIAVSAALTKKNKDKIN
ncbi:MAG: ComF family protein [Ruminococcaceae bacterium]|nr:ComF family protein [Oscillospiraceae bacterium]